MSHHDARLNLVYPPVLNHTEAELDINNYRAPTLAHDHCFDWCNTTFENTGSMYLIKVVADTLTECSSVRHSNECA